MNLRNILHVARYEYRTHFRRKGYLFATFGLPLLAALILLAVQTLNKRINVGTVLFGDHDKPLAVLDQAHLFERLPEPFVAVSDLESGKQGVRKGRYQGVLVIPADYPHTNPTLYTGSGPVAMDEAELQATHLLAYAELQDRYTYPEVQRLLIGPPIQIVSLSEAGAGEQGVGRIFVGLAFSFLFYIALFSSAGYLLTSVAQEKESRIMEILLSSITAMELLWGKVLGLGALGVTQVLIWFASARLLVQRALSPVTRLILDSAVQAIQHPDPQLILAVLLIMPMSYLTYGLLMAGLGSLGTNLRESQQFSAAVSMLAATPYMINPLITLNPNGVIPRALSYFPLTAPTALALRLGVSTVPWWDFALVTALTALGTLVSLWVGVRLFRVGILMYGRKPSWREIWHIIRNPA